MTIISETALLRSLVRLNISDTAAQNHLFNQISLVENQIRQLETANDILQARIAELDSQKKSAATKSKPLAVIRPDPADLECAHQLFEIKRTKQRTYTPNFPEWANDIAKIRQIKIPDASGELHQITHAEITSAFFYAFEVSTFWSTERLITSPQSLLNHLKRKRKTTFKDGFLDWLITTNGGLNATRRPNTQKARKSAQESIQCAINAAFGD